MKPITNTGPRNLAPKQEGRQVLRKTTVAQAIAGAKLVVKSCIVEAIGAGYSPKTASRIGPELLGKTCIAQAISEAQAKRAAQSARQAGEGRLS